MTEYIPYTYLIGWTEHDKWYYGCEYGNVTKVANPSNLWKTYFTSSTYVDDFRKQHGEPDVIEIRRTFKDGKAAVLWENKVIRRLKLWGRGDFLNKAHSGSIIYDDDVRAKMSKHAKKERSDLFRLRRSEVMKELWDKGVYNDRPPPTQEANQKNRESQLIRYATNPSPCLGRNLSEEHKKKIGDGVRNSEKYQEARKQIDFAGERNPMFGRQHSPETREKIRQAALARYRGAN